MDDLISRLQAAIEETERIALAANPSPWRFRIEGATHLDQDTIFGDGIPRGCDKLVNVANVDYAWEPEANAAHIIHHQPAAVLLRVAADRKILELAALTQEPLPEGWAWPIGMHRMGRTIIARLAEGYGIEVPAAA